MNFKSIAYSGIGGAEGDTVFNATKKGLSFFSAKNGQLVADAVLLALFGAEGDFSKITAPAEILVSFESGGKDFKVKRVFLEQDGEILEDAVLMGADEEVLTEGSNSVHLAVEELSGTNKTAFEKLFVMDKSLPKHILKGTDAESLIKEVYENLPKNTEIGEKIKDLKLKLSEAEKAIALKPYTRAEFAKQEGIVLDSKKSAETIKAGLRETYLKLAETFAVSGNSEVSEILSRCAVIEGEIKGELSELAKCQKQIAELLSKNGEATKSLKRAEQNYIILNEAETSSRKMLNSLVLKSAENPLNYNIYDKLSPYLEEANKEVAVLEQKRLKLEDEIMLTAELVLELSERRQALRCCATYKKNVNEAVTLESQLKVLNSDSSVLNEELKNNESELSEKSAELTALIEGAEDIVSRQSALSAEIRGGFETFSEAINYDAVLKHEIYESSISVGVLLKELSDIDGRDAKILKEIENEGALKAQTAQKMSAVEEYVQTLEEKLNLLEEKRAEYDSFNRMREISDALLYGDRCPVCDNAVSVKSELPLRNTKPIVKQIEAIRAEMVKSRDAITELMGGIARLESAKMAHEAFIETSAGEKERIYKTIESYLQKHEVATPQELHEKVLLIAQIADNRLARFDEFRMNEIETSRTREAQARLNIRITELSDKIIPSLKARTSALTAEISTLTASHDKLKEALNGENGSDLVLNLRISEKEYETAEDELSEKNERMEYLKEECRKVEKLINALTARSVPITADGKEYSFPEFTVKAIMHDIGKIVIECEKIGKDKEEAKKQILALQFIIRKQKAQLEELSHDAIAKESAINAKQGILKNLSERFKSADKSEAGNLSKDLEERLNALHATEKDAYKAMAEAERKLKLFKEHNEGIESANESARVLKEKLNGVLSAEALLPNGEDIPFGEFRKALASETNAELTSLSGGKLRFELSKAGKPEIKLSKDNKAVAESDIGGKDKTAVAYAMVFAFSKILKNLSSHNLICAVNMSEDEIADLNLEA
ncbi:MAG: hypothetical protein FWD49_04545 [Firmicutes bacterium]|nr:hypothetical protein [Bacillota bacterium]